MVYPIMTTGSAGAWRDFVQSRRRTRRLRQVEVVNFDDEAIGEDVVGASAAEISECAVFRVFRACEGTQKHAKKPRYMYRAP